MNRRTYPVNLIVNNVKISLIKQNFNCNNNNQHNINQPYHEHQLHKDGNRDSTERQIYKHKISNASSNSGNASSLNQNLIANNNMVASKIEKIEWTAEKNKICKVSICLIVL